jgi:hypothetical protein
MRWTMLPLLLLASACQKDFEQRYADAEQQLNADAKRLDAEMATSKNREMEMKSKALNEIE